MTPPPSKNVFSALRYRPFALLWAGQTLSRLGDTIYTVALAWWVLGETGSAETMSYVLLANVAPAVALGLFGGVIVDRLPRLRVMLAADVARTAINLAFAAGAASGELALWEVYLLSAAAGCCQAFFQPAYVAIVPEITPSERLVQANSLTTLSGQFGQILGPTIGALCIAVGGSELGFALNAITFAMSAVSLFWLGHLHIRIPRGGEGSSLLADLGDGLRTVAGQPWLWVTIVLASLANFTLAGPMRVTVPYLIREVRLEGALSLGILLSAGAAGSVLVALVFSSLGKLRRRGVIAYTALITNGVMLLVFAADGPIGLWWAAAFVGGAGLIVFELIWIGTLQEMVSGEKLGRVAAIDYVGSFGLLPVGLIVAGVLTPSLGARETLVLAGTAMCLLPLLALLSPAIRRLD